MGYLHVQENSRKFFKPILAKFRKEGHIVSCYIDDLYVQTGSYEQCVVSTLHVISTLVQLGLVIHPDKSVLIPKQNITALGFNIDSCLMTVSITDAKILKIQSLIQETLKNKDILKIRNVPKIIGHIISTLPASKFGKLYYRNLEKDKSGVLTAARGNFEAIMTISDEGVNELIWWLKILHLCTRKLFHQIFKRPYIQMPQKLDGGLNLMAFLLVATGIMKNPQTTLMFWNLRLPILPLNLSLLQ